MNLGTASEESRNVNSAALQWLQDRMRQNMPPIEQHPGPHRLNDKNWGPQSTVQASTDRAVTELLGQRNVQDRELEGLTNDMGTTDELHEAISRPMHRLVEHIESKDGSAKHKKALIDAVVQQWTKKVMGIMMDALDSHYDLLYEKKNFTAVEDWPEAKIEFSVRPKADFTGYDEDDL